MLIGNQYADNKMYRGIKYYDALPLTSEDLQEYFDTIYRKLGYFLNNTVGYGTINSPGLTLSTAGIKLKEPAAILVNGDIALIQADTDTPIVTTSEISNAGYESGVLCIVGWYQHITSSNVIRNYGGCDNSILENDLINTQIGLQLSSRYQFRWCTTLLDESTLLSSETLTLSIPSRDDTGAVTTGTTSIVAGQKVNSVFVAPTPTNMTYALSDIYIVPILRYKYADNAISSVSVYPPISLGKGTQRASVTLTVATSIIEIPYSIYAQGVENMTVYHNGILLELGTNYTIDDLHISLIDYQGEIDDVFTFVIG